MSYFVYLFRNSAAFSGPVLFLEGHTIIKKGQSVCDFAATRSHVNALVKHHQRFVLAENIYNYFGNVCCLGNDLFHITHTQAPLKGQDCSHIQMEVPIIHYSYMFLKILFLNNY